MPAFATRDWIRDLVGARAGHWVKCARGGECGGGTEAVGVGEPEAGGSAAHARVEAECKTEEVEVALPGELSGRPEEV